MSADTQGLKPARGGIFDQEAGRYDAWFESEPGRALFASEVSCLRHLLGGLPRPWIEVGVGTGRFAEALKIDVGVDPAPRALGYAVNRGVNGLLALGESLPFGDRKFGAVFVIVTLCFAGDPAALLREARRVVVDEGGLVLGIVPADSPWGRRYKEQATAGHLFYAQARLFTCSELEDLVQSADLRIERIVSTVTQRPGDTPFAVETPREGLHQEASFLGLLCRPRPNGARKGGRGCVPRCAL